MKYNLAYLPFLAVFTGPLTRTFDYLYQYTSDVMQPFIFSDTPTTIFLCGNDDDVMKVLDIDIDPNPPRKGENVSIIAFGSLQETLNDGAYIVAEMKKGVLRFPKIKASICENLVGGCPVQKGATKLELKFEIPKVFPSGNYEVKAVVYNADDKFVESRKGKIMNRRLKGSISQNSDLIIQGRQVMCLSGTTHF